MKRRRVIVALCFLISAAAVIPVEGSLSPLLSLLGSEAHIGYVSWKPVDFRKAGQAGFTTVWIATGPFLHLSADDQKDLLRQAASSGLKSLGFVGGEPNWVRPGFYPKAVQEYQRLTQVLGRYVEDDALGELRFAFATDVEPHTKRWWDGNLRSYSDLLEQHILRIAQRFAKDHPNRIVEPLLTRFEPFWWENGHITDSGKVIRGLRDFPSVVAAMTYRNTGHDLEEVSRIIRRRAGKTQGLQFMIGVETKPPGPGIPYFITFDGQLGEIPQALTQAIEALPDADRARMRGVFIHSGRDQADAILDQLG